MITTTVPASSTPITSVMNGERSPMIPEALAVMSVTNVDGMAISVKNGIVV